MVTSKYSTYMPMWATVYTDPPSTQPHRWMPQRRHIKIRDTFATFLDEVCHDVDLEPKLQLLEGESFRNKTTTTEDDIRLDIKGKMTQGKTFSIIFFQTPC